MEFGGFDERFGKPAGEDFDLKQRICKEGHKVAFVPIAVVHNESYDLDYLLRQILKRGSEKRFRESKGAMIAELFLNFPFIMLNLFRKFLKYRRDYKR